MTPRCLGETYGRFWGEPTASIITVDKIRHPPFRLSTTLIIQAAGSSQNVSEFCVTNMESYFRQQQS